MTGDDEWLDQLESSATDPLVPSRTWPAPGQRHPWYADKPEVVAWLDVDPFDGRDHYLTILVPPQVIVGYQVGDEARLVEFHTVRLTRHQVVAPCPYVGSVPLLYRWWVGVDQHKRMVASRVWHLLPCPPYLRWGGPFDIG